MHLSALNIHPVKSTAVRPVTEAYVGPAGLRSDREWMVIDVDGDLVSARDLPSLFGITADTPATDPTLSGQLRLRADGAADLLLDPPTADPVTIRVHRTEGRGIPLGDACDAWLRAVTGRSDLRMVWCHAPSARRLNPEWARPTDYTAFADSAPVTLVSTASVAQLDEWIVETALERGEEAPNPLTVNRFRPNLVIDGVGRAFAEDSWSHVRIGEVPFRVAAQVDRCVMTTVDTETFEKGKEPIRTLARHRRWDGKTWLAVKLLPDGEGTIRLGDEVVPTTRAE